MSMRSRNRAIHKILCVFLLAVMLSVPAGHLRAVSGDGLVAYPSNPDPNNPQSNSWFIYSLDRGQSKQDSLTVRNNSEQTQTIKIYPVDATTNNVGEFALEAEKDSRDAIGKWISLETDSVTLQPGEEKKVGFNISIPQNVSSGEISGGIIIEKAAPQAQNASQGGFIINTRIGIRVYETVPGEVIRKVSFGDSTLEYDKDNRTYTLNVMLKNEGNISLEPALIVDIKDTIFGTQNQQLQQKTMIPREGQVKATFTFQKPKVGKFEITPEATYEKENGQKETVISPYTLSFWALPWDEILIACLLIVANILFLAILNILSRKERKYYKSYRVQKGDNLNIIAKKLGTDWKKLANINKMKAPYQVGEGQIITVFDKKDMLEQLYMENEKITKTEKISMFLNKEKTDQKTASADKKKGIIGNISAKLGLRSDVFLLIFIAFSLLIAAYMLYARVFIKKNNLSFTYENSSARQESKNNENEEIKNVQIPSEEKTETNPEGLKPVTEEDAPQEISPEDRKKVSIKILNGSGIKGASSAAYETLSKKGYTNISTGNADSFSYTKTLLECPDSIKEAICREIESALSEKYKNIESVSAGETGTDYIKIILGR